MAPHYKQDVIARKDSLKIKRALIIKINSNLAKHFLMIE
jgi:hypothetical protein